MKTKNVWLDYNEKETKKVYKYATEYMDFLNHGKTERECTDYIINEIEAKGYQEFSVLLKKKKQLTT